MNIIKRILLKFAEIIHFRLPTEEEKLEYGRKYSFRSYSKENSTTINPASGLPMIGCLDVNGNSYGSNSSSDHYHRNHEAIYSSYSTSNYSSSYDPFTNRY